MKRHPWKQGPPESLHILAFFLSGLPSFAFPLVLVAQFAEEEYGDALS